MQKGDNNMGDVQTFADWFREKTRGKSQRDVAMNARVSPTTIGNYYLGRLPSLDDVDLLRRIAEALHVTDEELTIQIRAEKQRRAEQEAISSLSDADLEEMIKAYRSARHDSARKRMLETVKEILEEEAQEEPE
jgi:transcriptional regulator with XRE-family HTH domain